MYNNKTNLCVLLGMEVACGVGVGVGRLRQQSDALDVAEPQSCVYFHVESTVYFVIVNHTTAGRAISVEHLSYQVFLTWRSQVPQTTSWRGKWRTSSPIS
jgi:hypothetical protein